MPDESQPVLEYAGGVGGYAQPARHPAWAAMLLGLGTMLAIAQLGFGLLFADWLGNLALPLLGGGALGLAAFALLSREPPRWRIALLVLACTTALQAYALRAASAHDRRAVASITAGRRGEVLVNVKSDAGRDLATYRLLIGGAYPAVALWGTLTVYAFVRLIAGASSRRRN